MLHAFVPGLRPPAHWLARHPDRRHGIALSGDAGDAKRAGVFPCAWLAMAELARNRLRTKWAERVENPNHSDPFGLTRLSRASHLVEPPTADPHGGWCGGRGRETPGYPIGQHACVTDGSSCTQARPFEEQF